MFNKPTLIKYLARLFAGYFILTTIVVVALLFLAHTFDILQKFKSSDVSPNIFWLLISLKIPYLYNEISTIVGFLATLLFLRRITMQNEMLIILGSGMPIWQIFVIPTIVTFLFGIIILGAINPIGVYGLKQYKKLEAQIKETPQNSFIVSPSGIFFFENFQGNNRIIQTKSINSAQKELTGVTILIVDKENHFSKRIDTPKAKLEIGSFKLTSPRITTESDTKILKEQYIPTNLSISNLLDRFIAPEMIPIWSLKERINIFAESGIVTTNYQIYYYKQLFKPLIMMAMAFLACWFVSLNSRDNSSGKTLILGILVGITTYFLLEIILRILTFSGFTPIYAILLPVLAIIMISNFVILHFQEG